MTTTKKPNPRKVKAILEALKEIEASFELLGLGSMDDSIVNNELEPEDVEDEVEAEEEESYGNASFDREDIEVAIDTFVSELIDGGIVRSNNSAKMPRFGDVFAKAFGTNHEIVQKANEFEESIKGYFGYIDYDDMKTAQNRLAEIRELLEKALKQHAPN